MMKTYAAKFGVVSAALLIASVGSAAVAATISTAAPPVASGPGLGLVSVPAIFTPNPNNDNQTGGGPADNNVVIPLKRFDFNDYIDIEFVVTATDGVTEYKVTEFVDNNTGVNWSSYTMQLGTGVGGGFTPFVGGGLDFDAPGFDTPPTSTGPLSIVATSPYQLKFSGGSQSTGAQQYLFRLDIPDSFPGGNNSFTLRQFPTPVPEPSAIALFVMGLFASAVGRRRAL
jgi:hypothetical protein